MFCSGWIRCDIVWTACEDGISQSSYARGYLVYQSKCTAGIKACSGFFASLHVDFAHRWGTSFAIDWWWMNSSVNFNGVANFSSWKFLRMTSTEGKTVQERGRHSTCIVPIPCPVFSFGLATTTVELGTIVQMLVKCKWTPSCEVCSRQVVLLSDFTGLGICPGIPTSQMLRLVMPTLELF